MTASTKPGVAIETYGITGPSSGKAPAKQFMQGMMTFCYTCATADVVTDGSVNAGEAPTDCYAKVLEVSGTISPSPPGDAVKGTKAHDGSGNLTGFEWKNEPPHSPGQTGDLLLIPALGTTTKARKRLVIWYVSASNPTNAYYIETRTIEFDPVPNTTTC